MEKFDLKRLFNKFYLLSLLVSMTAIFMACEPAKYIFHYEELKNSIVKIELINYKNEEARFIKEKEDILPFNFQKEEIIEMLDGELLNDFLVDFSDAAFFQNYWDQPDSPMGVCLKLTYENGDFIIASDATIKGRKIYQYICIFYSNGYVKEFIGGFSGKMVFSNLVNSYFETQIIH